MNNQQSYLLTKTANFSLLYLRFIIINLIIFSFLHRPHQNLLYCILCLFILHYLNHSLNWQSPLRIFKLIHLLIKKSLFPTANQKTVFAYCFFKYSTNPVSSFSSSSIIHCFWICWTKGDSKSLYCWNAHLNSIFLTLHLCLGISSLPRF